VTAILALVAPPQTRALLRALDSVDIRHTIKDASHSPTIDSARHGGD